MEKEKMEKLITVPNNGQISIGRKFAGQTFKMIVDEDSGTIVFERGEFIPHRNRTFYTKQAEEQLADFNAWSSQNPPDEKTVEQGMKVAENILQDAQKKAGSRSRKSKAG